MSKQYKVVLAFDVQQTFFVEANNQEEAEEKARDGEGYNQYYDHYDFDDYVETVEVNNNDNLWKLKNSKSR